MTWELTVHQLACGEQLHDAPLVLYILIIIIVVAILLSFSSFSILKLSLCQHTSFYLFKSLPCPTGGAGRRE